MKSVLAGGCGSEVFKQAFLKGTGGVKGSLGKHKGLEVLEFILK